MKYNSLGQELPDPTPVALPIGFEKPEPLNSVIQRLVRTEVSQAADQKGMETFEEANNFNTGEDDPEPLTAAERAAELGEHLQIDKDEILEAEKSIKVQMAELEKKRREAREARERRDDEAALAAESKSKAQ